MLFGSDIIMMSTSLLWTHHGNNKGEEPGIDEKVIPTSFDDEDECSNNGKNDYLHHYKLFQLVLYEES